MERVYRGVSQLSQNLAGQIIARHWPNYWLYMGLGIQKKLRLKVGNERNEYTGVKIIQFSNT